MKNKALTILVIGLLVFSSLSLSAAKLVKCPDCNGSGEVDCPTCDGTGKTGASGTTTCTYCLGSGTYSPVKPTPAGMTVEQSEGSTWINGTF